MPGNKEPLVSIIMNCYNSERWLKEAIDSIYAQTYQNWEIIFWDNASTDNSANIANSYDDKLKYYKGEDTIPLYAARNMALEKCQGELIAFLDCDDVYMPEKIALQVKLFCDNEVGLVYSDSIFFNKSGLLKRNFSNHKPLRGYVADELLKDYFLDIESVVIRRSVLTKSHLKFDDSLNVIGDFYLFILIITKCKIDFIAQPLVRCRFHEKSLSETQKDKTVREFEYVYNKLVGDKSVFFSSYSLKCLKTKILFYKAMTHWSKGESRCARKVIAPALLFDIKYVIFYFLTFLPYASISIVLRKFYPII